MMMNDSIPNASKDQIRKNDLIDHMIQETFKRSNHHIVNYTPSSFTYETTRSHPALISKQCNTIKVVTKSDIIMYRFKNLTIHENKLLNKTTGQLYQLTENETRIRGRTLMSDYYVHQILYTFSKTKPNLLPDTRHQTSSSSSSDKDTHYFENLLQRTKEVEVNNNNNTNSSSSNGNNNNNNNLMTRKQREAIIDMKRHQLSLIPANFEKLQSFYDQAAEDCNLSIDERLEFPYLTKYIIIPKMLLNQIPAQIGSPFTHQYENFSNDVCSYDNDGAFIINGINRSQVASSRFSYNQALITKEKHAGDFKVQIEYRADHPDVNRSSSTLFIYILPANKNRHYEINIKLPYTNKNIPLYEIVAAILDDSTECVEEYIALIVAEKLRNYFKSNHLNYLDSEQNVHIHSFLLNAYEKVRKENPLDLKEIVHLFRLTMPSKILIEALNKQRQELYESEKNNNDTIHDMETNNNCGLINCICSDSKWNESSSNYSGNVNIQNAKKKRQRNAGQYILCEGQRDSLQFISSCLLEDQSKIKKQMNPETSTNLQNFDSSNKPILSSQDPVTTTTIHTPHVYQLRNKSIENNSNNKMFPFFENDHFQYYSNKFPASQKKMFCSQFRSHYKSLTDARKELANEFFPNVEYLSKKLHFDSHETNKMKCDALLGMVVDGLLVLGNRKAPTNRNEVGMNTIDTQWITVFYRQALRARMKGCSRHIVKRTNKNELISNRNVMTYYAKKNPTTKKILPVFSTGSLCISKKSKKPDSRNTGITQLLDHSNKIASINQSFKIVKKVNHQSKEKDLRRVSDFWPSKDCLFITDGKRCGTNLLGTLSLYITPKSDDIFLYRWLFDYGGVVRSYEIEKKEELFKIMETIDVTKPLVQPHIITQPSIVDSVVSKKRKSDTLLSSSPQKDASSKRSRYSTRNQSLDSSQVFSPPPPAPHTNQKKRKHVEDDNLNLNLNKKNKQQLQQQEEQKKQPQQIYYEIILNGSNNPIGYHSDPEWLMQAFRNVRDMDTFTDIQCYMIENKVFFNTQEGQTFSRLFNARRLYAYNKKYGVEALRQMTGDDLFRNRIVENVGSYEQGVLVQDLDEYHYRVIVNGEKNITYMIGAPILSQGMSTSLIPLVEHNIPNRGSNSSSMNTKVVGMPLTNYATTYDPSCVYFIPLYPETPLVFTKSPIWLNIEKFAGGVNKQMCIGNFGGYNQDDSYIIKDTYVSQTLSISTCSDEEKNYDSSNNNMNNNNNSKVHNSDPDHNLNDIPILNSSGEHFANAMSFNCQNIKHAKYDCTGSDGLPIVGANIQTENSVIFSKIVPKEHAIDQDDEMMTNEDNDNNNQPLSIKLNYYEKSTLSSKKYRGRVDSVVLTTNDKGNRIARAHLVHQNDITVGCKVCSFQGQKNIIGQIYAEHNMYFDHEGMTPDVILSHLAISSRMTVAVLIEILAGDVMIKTGAQFDCSYQSKAYLKLIEKANKYKQYSLLFDDYGVAGSESPLVPENIEDELIREQHKLKAIKHVLKEMKYVETGTRAFFHPVNGMRIGGDDVTNGYGLTYSGMSYVQHFNRIPECKVTVRGSGVVDELTGQCRGEGKRMGEMELHTLVSNEASNILDNCCNFGAGPCMMHVCTECGNEVSVNLNKASTICKVCEKATKIGKIKTNKYFATKLSLLKAANLTCKMQTREILN
jgi:DNA-directed RNA polymerase beta subunit